MEQILQSLGVLVMGMCGIFLVMDVISVAISVLNRFFKS